MEQEVAKATGHPVTQIKRPEDLGLIQQPFQEVTHETCGKQTYYYYKGGVTTAPEV
jgi:hypothetical protein